MLAPVTHILPLATVRRERLLPVSGRVVVRKGQKISATDVIAEANLHPKHLMMDVARALGVSMQEADRHIKCQAGTQISQGDVLAGPVGMMQRVLRAPQDGRVVVAGEGQILVELDNPPFELKAGIPGTISEIVTDRGAVIQTTGAIVQGVWGNGQIDFGLMNVLARSPEDELTPDRLDVSLRGSVVLAGYCSNADVLTTASELPLRGLILASMEISLLKLAQKMRYPIILIEGFGKRSMNSTAYKLLTTNERREAAINAGQWDRFTGIRPEVIIELPASGHPAMPRETEIFSSDQPVRLFRAPYAGKVGVLINILPGLSVLPSGLVAKAAEVRLENGEEVVVPLANLEVIA